MVLGLKKTVVDDLVFLAGAIILFNTLIKFPIISKYIEQYRIVFVILAILLIVYRNKIADAIGE